MLRSYGRIVDLVMKLVAALILKLKVGSIGYPILLGSHCVFLGQPLYIYHTVYCKFDSSSSVASDTTLPEHLQNN